MRARSYLVVFLSFMVVGGCASTGVTSSWVAPDAGPIAFQRTLIVVMHPVEAVRRIGEDRLVRRLGRGRAVASHTVISQDDLRDTDVARAAVDQAGVDGVVLMRVVSQEQALSYQPGMVYPAAYGQFWGFYGYVAPIVYGPTYLRSETVVNVETNVYSVADEKLLWSGISEAFNPIDVGATVDEIADAVSEELRREGLLTE